MTTHHLCSLCPLPLSLSIKLCLCVAVCIVGTYEYTTPEWFLDGRYRAEPTTVWQLGVVLFGMLHRRLPFRDSSEIVHENPDVGDGLTFGKS